MKQKIRLTESQLHNLINECVMRILEAHGQGLSYATAKSAYNKMIDMGQKERAARLNQTYAEVNNDNDASYDLHADDITFNGGDDKSDTVFYGNHVTPSDLEKGWARTTKRYKDGTVFDADDNDSTTFVPQSARVPDAKTAIRRAQHLNNFYGKQKFNKNDFRA